ncbi:MAG: hypothetical protein WD042_17140 [Phycisphaeraceae bacterium]
MAWVSTRSSGHTPISTGNPGPTAPVINAASTPPLHTKFALEPRTLNELLELPVERLGEVDIARMNLLCASALPSTQSLNIEHALSVLDEWAGKVAFETDRHLYRVTDPRFADRYHGSEPHFRAEMLAQVLQEDLGVRYNPKAIGDFSFADLTTGFIHGIIPAPGKTTADTPGGTCASMPVLYVAVGRRLGYPLKLATTDGHIFARWDGLDHANPAWRERFNCETTNGFHRFDDDYYKTWPHKISDWEIQVKGHLLSLSPAEELAEFLATRGHHAEDVGQVGFAARCFENAYRYDSRRPCYGAWFVGAAMRSGYRPATPELAKLLAYKQRSATAARRPSIDGMPMPSEMAAAARMTIPFYPNAVSSRAGQRQYQPTILDMPQPAIPPVRPVNPHPQFDQFNPQPPFDRFRSQP